MIPWYLLVASTFSILCPFVRGFRRAITFGHARVFVSASNKDFEKNGFQGKIEEYNYSDEDGSYDVPFVREQKWYRLNVKKASEKSLYEYFQQHSKATDSIWKDVVIDAYYPSKSYLTFKGKNLQIKSKAMIPGLLYLKTSRMDIDVADDLEQVENVYMLTKTAKGIVVPLSDEEVSQLNVMRNISSIQMDRNDQMVKKDSYVSIIMGEHKGKYGIVTGARGGKLEVCLRSEYKDDWDVFNINEVRHLSFPPEKNWQALTAKEAVKNLMAKNPKSPTIRSLREQGLIEEILYPQRKSQNKYKERHDSGSKAISSLSKQKDVDHHANDMDFKSLLRSVDVEDKKSNGGQGDLNIPTLSGDNEKGPAGLIVSNHGEISETYSPKMEEFASFEDYLDALVSYDRKNSLSTKQTVFEEQKGCTAENYKRNEGSIEHNLDSFFDKLEDI